MPLPIPNLDDTTFQSLVDDAVRAIPRHAPEWTDNNLHDPGITFIELFSWLAEIQQYYVNRIRDDNYRKFLALLGIRPGDATPALADITFTPNNNAVTAVPQGAKLSTGSLVFETVEPLAAMPARLAKIASVSSAGVRDNTAANATDGISYGAFGDNAETGSRLYLGFLPPSGAAQPFPPGSPVAVTFQLFEDYPVARGVHGNEAAAVIPSARILWEYFRSDDTWAPLNVAALLEPLLAALPLPGGPLCDNVQANVLAAVNGSPLYAKLSAAAQAQLAAALGNAQTTCALRAIPTDPVLLALCRDETAMLSTSGRFFFGAPGDMKAAALPPFPDPYFLIRLTVAEQGYEVPPRLQKVLLNTVSAAQTDTLSEVTSFSSGGAPSAFFDTATFLAREGDVDVQVQEEGGLWRQWRRVDSFDASGPADFHYTYSAGRLTFGDGAKGKIPPAGTNNIRVIACLQGGKAGRLIGKGSGYPGQQFTLGPGGVLPATLLLQTSLAPADPNPLWQDWTPVDNFDNSAPGDTHFVFDSPQGLVRFGDGVNGAAPPAPSTDVRNVQWIRLLTGGGAQGNAGAGSISQAGQPFAGAANLSWTNSRQATGGADAETLAAAEIRARRELRTPFRAVTSEDFEFVARATPGLRVARAKALPLYDPATPADGSAAVTVVVVPYSPSPVPVPSRGFLKTVCRHLWQHRLITTKVKAIAPAYITVSVQAAITLQAGARSAAVQQAAVAALQQFLDPLTGGKDKTGWPFGRPVYKSEIYQLLDGVAAVNCVSSLALSASGKGASTTAEGDIAIPPEALVVSGNHTITIASASGTCPPKGGCR